MDFDSWSCCLWLCGKVAHHSMAAMAEEIHGIQKPKKERKTPKSQHPL